MTDSTTAALKPTASAAPAEPGPDTEDAASVNKDMSEAMFGKRPKRTAGAKKATTTAKAGATKKPTTTKTSPSLSAILADLKPGKPAEIALRSIAHIKGGTDAYRRMVYGVARAKNIAVSTTVDADKKVVRIWLKDDTASAPAKAPKTPPKAPKPKAVKAAPKPAPKARTRKAKTPAGVTSDNPVTA